VRVARRGSRGRSDLELERADLERARDEIYARLRDHRRRRDSRRADRRDFELQARAPLRRLEEIDGEQRRTARRAASGRSTAEAAAGRAPRARTPA
jgi:hypothetical protein